MPPQARGWMASVSSIAILVIFSLCSICCVDGKIAQPPRMVLAKPSASHTGNVPRGRRLDDTADDIGSNNNTTASYFKCYSLLEQVTASSNADSSVLGQEEYLAFLRLLTGGTVSYDRFADLPAVYVMIFYTAACITPDDCQQDSEPVVRLNNDQNEETTADQSPTVQLFCKQILKSTPSAADAVFDYSIRYNPENLNIEDLAVCLSTATVNVLLEQLAGCPFLSAENSNATTDEGNDARRQRARNLLLLGQQAIAPSALLSSLQQQQQYSSYSYHSKKELRRLQSLGTVSTPEDSACQYAIESTVESITELRKSRGLFL